MKSIHEQIKSLRDEWFKRYMRLTKVEYLHQRKTWEDPNFDQIIEDIQTARKENKELDLWVDGYIKKTDWGYIHRQEILF